MAIAINGNTVYIPDSTSDEAINVPANNIVKIVAIVVTPTTNNASVTLTDNDDNKTSKIKLDWPTDNESREYLFERTPIIFPNGVRATTTNCIVTLVFTR